MKRFCRTIELMETPDEALTWAQLDASQLSVSCAHLISFLHLIMSAISAAGAAATGSPTEDVTPAQNMPSPVLEGPLGDIPAEVSSRSSGYRTASDSSSPPLIHYRTTLVPHKSASTRRRSHRPTNSLPPPLLPPPVLQLNSLQAKQQQQQPRKILPL
jgi:hypothetical protein